MAHVLVSNSIGMGWDFVVIDSRPDELFCIEVQCDVCRGSGYTTEFHYGRQRLFIHLCCSVEHRPHLESMMKARAIRPDVFSCRN